ncbi:MAG: hypothetical protein ACYDCQ_14300, partial [Dehalococcoidia bacterium]
LTEAYRDFVVSLFTAWQPTLAEALRRAFGAGIAAQLLAETAVDPGAPPAQVRIEQWLALFIGFVTIGSERDRRRIHGAYKRLQVQQEALQKLHRTRVRRSRPRPPTSAIQRHVYSGTGYVYRKQGTEEAAWQRISAGRWRW